jgi:hypothetical protein
MLEIGKGGQKQGWRDDFGRWLVAMVSWFTTISKIPAAEPVLALFMTEVTTQQQQCFRNAPQANLCDVAADLVQLRCQCD